MKLYEGYSLTPFLRPETKSPWGILSMEQAPNWGLRIPGSITATSASAPSSPIFFYLLQCSYGFSLQSRGDS